MIHPVVPLAAAGATLAAFGLGCWAVALPTVGDATAFMAMAGVVGGGVLTGYLAARHKIKAARDEDRKADLAARIAEFREWEAARKDTLSAKVEAQTNQIEGLTAELVEVRRREEAATEQALATQAELRQTNELLLESIRREAELSRDLSRMAGMVEATGAQVQVNAGVIDLVLAAVAKQPPEVLRQIAARLQAEARPAPAPEPQSQPHPSPQPQPDPKPEAPAGGKP